MFDIPGLDTTVAEHYRRIENVNMSAWRYQTQGRKRLGGRAAMANLFLRLAEYLDEDLVARRRVVEQQLRTGHAA
jgi:hypothetical protein